MRLVGLHLLVGSCWFMVTGSRWSGPSPGWYVGKRSVSTQLQQTVGRKDSCKNTPRQKVPVKVLQQLKTLKLAKLVKKSPRRPETHQKCSPPARSTTSAGRCQTWVDCLSSGKPTSSIIGGQLISKVKRLWEWDFWVCVFLCFSVVVVVVAADGGGGFQHPTYKTKALIPKKKGAWCLKCWDSRSFENKPCFEVQGMVIQNYLTLKHSKF